jgi:hypothetical protein
VQALALDQARQVHRDEFGQLDGQALDLDFGGDVVDQALVGLHGFGVLFAGEVQRHLLAQRVVSSTRWKSMCRICCFQGCT